MHKNQSRYSWAAFGYMPVIESGLRDACQPAGLTALMFFFIFLYFVLKRARPLIRHGLFFILGLWFGKILILGGLLDDFLRNKFFWLSMELTYIAFTLFMIVLGCLLLRDWWVLRYKENYDAVIIKSPFENLIERSRGVPANRQKWFRLPLAFIKALFGTFLSFWGGLLVAFVVSPFAEDTNILYILYEASFPRDVFDILKLTFMYVFSFTIIITLFLVAVWSLIRKGRTLQNLNKHFATVQAFFSAVFLAYGMGMLILIVFK